MPLIWKIQMAMVLTIHSVFGLMVEFGSVEWRYFELDQFQ